MHKISKCRLCSSSELISVLDLGKQKLTGVFPRSIDQNISSGPLSLVWCNSCNLLQLHHSYDPNEMYGENYGYRSGLNTMMVNHLSAKTDLLTKQIGIRSGDSVLDIGSNDGTLLKSYNIDSLRKVGVDPTGSKFSHFYPNDIELIQDFFTASLLKGSKFKGGMRLLDVKMNAVNGGSFAVTACHHNASFKANDSVISWLLEQERNMGLNTPKPFTDFKNRVFDHKNDLKSLLIRLKEAGKVVHGYGASTKGNVLLQFCDITTKEIPYIAEINQEKFGCFSPGSNIPIISDAESKAMKPDYYLVLPWHFKSGIVNNEKEFLAKGGSLIFPLPEIEII